MASKLAQLDAQVAAIIGGLAASPLGRAALGRAAGVRSPCHDLHLP